MNRSGKVKIEKLGMTRETGKIGNSGQAGRKAGI